MENADVWVNLISNVGFPIVMAIVLLRTLTTRIQEQLDKLNETMSELLVAIKEHSKPS
ncbi:YvrJ family protein [Paenibacillus hunanensis]|uniref:YvrJ family protein n=1 Tax=Paenibacillus hunanensis TaxID=539262 RepID=UPI0020267118|nr:YvrJ family protein [Paenibacillus hunanensis]MCL9662175.1 YvrJ family protein [Paenibacillus hunanensis]